MENIEHWAIVVLPVEGMGWFVQRDEVLYDEDPVAADPSNSRKRVFVEHFVPNILERYRMASDR